jgi:hypothetical protein
LGKRIPSQASLEASFKRRQCSNSVCRAVEEEEEEEEEAEEEEASFTTTLILLF